MSYDILIIGGGPAGLSFAKALSDTNLNIGLVEKSSANTLKNPAYDGREIALTHLSKKIMSELGMWDIIPQEDISIIRHAKVLNGNSNYTLHFDHNESGKENLGFMMANNVIRKAAYDALENTNNITLLTEKEVSSVTTNDQYGSVKFSDNSEIKAPLIIAADSRFSSTRRMMGISTSMLDFGRTCIVCTMSAELPHNETAYECFHYDRTLAVLPLNNNQVSIVITLNSEESDLVLSMDKQEFAADIERRIDGCFGSMELTSELFPYPLVATFAKTFHTNRFAVIGDAAVGMHPVTAHGFNLGLRGAYTLAKELKKEFASDISTSPQAALTRYSRKHRRAAAPLYHGTNALVKLYTKDTPPAKIARSALLRLGNRIKPAKRLIMNQLTESKAA